MKSNMFRLALLLMATLIALPMAVAKDQTLFAYASKDDSQEGSGTGLHETYDVAIALHNSQLEGKQITAIEIPIYPSEYISGLQIWIADELKLELIDGKKKNITNQCFDIEYPTEGDLQYIKYELEEPYTIPAGGTYVGYSLTVNELKVFHPETYAPLLCALKPNTGGLYLHTSRSFLDWQDRSDLLGCTAMTQVYIEGDFMLNAASLGSVDLQYIATGSQQSVNIPVHNIGLSPIESIEYTTTMADGSSFSGEIIYDEPLPAVFAYTHSSEFLLPEINELGISDITVTIDRVNNTKNDYSDASLTFKAKALPFVPKHLAVVEEYTGTWCGWCSRGYVAMELMSQLNPEFIGIAYHNLDPMEMVGGYPLLTTGAPSATVNRLEEVDPFYAKGVSSGFKMPELYNEYCQGFVPVGIDLHAVYNADGTVTVNSSTRWADTAEPGDYAIEYVLLADDVYDINGTGNPKNWSQHNYYSTEPVQPYLEWICSQPEYITGLHFNDVAIITSGLRGVEGSIASTSVGYDNAHTYVFDTAKALNPVYNNNGSIRYTQPIPFHPDKLRVVAMLLDRSDKTTLGSIYGKIINAAKCNVEFNEDGISDALDNEEIVSETYFDLRGIQIDEPSAPGLYIKKVKYANGSTASFKEQISK